MIRIILWTIAIISIPLAIVSAVFGLYFTCLAFLCAFVVAALRVTASK